MKTHFLMIAKFLKTCITKLFDDSMIFSMKSPFLMVSKFFDDRTIHKTLLKIAKYPKIARFV